MIKAFVNLFKQAIAPIPHIDVKDKATFKIHFKALWQRFLAMIAIMCLVITAEFMLISSIYVFSLIVEAFQQ